MKRQLRLIGIGLTLGLLSGCVPAPSSEPIPGDTSSEGMSRGDEAAGLVGLFNRKLGVDPAKAPEQEEHLRFDSGEPQKLSVFLQYNAARKPPDKVSGDDSGIVESVGAPDKDPRDDAHYQLTIKKLSEPKGIVVAYYQLNGSVLKEPYAPKLEKEEVESFIQSALALIENTEGIPPEVE